MTSLENNIENISYSSVIKLKSISNVKKAPFSEKQVEFIGCNACNKGHGDMKAS